MRLFHVLSILSLLFGARAFSLDSRQSDAHPLDARDVSDVCATLDPLDPSEVNLLNALLPLGLLGQFDVSMSQPISRVLSVIIGSCLCLSQVSQFLEEDPFLAIFGDDSTTLTNFVRRKITFPLSLFDSYLNLD